MKVFILKLIKDASYSGSDEKIIGVYLEPHIKVAEKKLSEYVCSQKAIRLPNNQDEVEDFGRITPDTEVFALEYELNEGSLMVHIGSAPDDQILKNHMSTINVVEDELTAISLH